jgi:hypothetical protein
MIRALSLAEQEEVVRLCLDDVVLRPMIVGTLANPVSLVTASVSSASHGSRSKQRLTYHTNGELQGSIRDHDVVVKQLGKRFTTLIDGVEHSYLTKDFVEGTLGLVPQMKRSGLGASETLARTVWRHLVDRYNNSDPGVSLAP